MSSVWDLGPPFEGPDPAARDKYKREREEAWEERVVRDTMTRLAGRGAVDELRAAGRRLTGSPVLTLDNMYRLFVGFPVYLVPRRIPYVHQVSYIDLMERPATTVLYKAYRAAAEEVPDDFAGRPVALVYNRPQRGTEVFHDFDLGKPAPRCVRLEIDAKVLYVEKYADFLARRVAPVFQP